MCPFYVVSLSHTFQRISSKHSPSGGGSSIPRFKAQLGATICMGNFNHMFYQAKFSQTLPKTNMAMENDNFRQEIHLQMVDVPLPYWFPVSILVQHETGAIFGFWPSTSINTFSSTWDKVMFGIVSICLAIPFLCWTTKIGKTLVTTLPKACVL